MILKLHMKKDKSLYELWEYGTWICDNKNYMN